MLKDGSSDKIIYSEARVVTRIEMAQLQFRREHAHISRLRHLVRSKLGRVDYCVNAGRASVQRNEVEIKRVLNLCLNCE